MSLNQTNGFNSKLKIEIYFSAALISNLSFAFSSSIMMQLRKSQFG